ncbi:ABC transporter substrate-binding protein [Streptomyces sp. NPDC059455]|uniref:ABC transporter substrate-binding protein n=1 Tax=Streptomyces sp. NPDC059455 TaxID=3346837 RepID=UPI0036CAF008
MRRSLAARAALVISALLVVAGCGGGGGGGSADPKHPVTIDVAVLAATEFYVLPWPVGQKQGFFADHGVVVKDIVAGSGGSATLRTQLSGGIPIGEIGYKSVLDASKEGIPVLAVGGGAPEKKANAPQSHRRSSNSPRRCGSVTCGSSRWSSGPPSCPRSRPGCG